MELMLIRHGLPVRRELSEGIADPELSDAGQAQARLLADYLASESIDAVYASPLRRAYETAEALATPRGLEITVVDGVAEWDRNASEYIPIEELKAANDPRWHAAAAGDWANFEETPEAFRTRVVDAVETIIDAHSGELVAISCHGGVINAYVMHILGLPVSHGFFYPNYTSIHRVAASRQGHRSVVTLNETSHLRGSGLPMGLVQQS
jgi:probable phosphoglycerate mutase